jgi:protein-tyrosine phosphatase
MTAPASPRPSHDGIAATWRLLFVCLGNICRSPLAEGVFLAVASERGIRDRFHVDSCGLGGWHAGERPDPRAMEVARRFGVELDHCARQLDPTRDFERFDLLLAMDRENLSGILRAGGPPDRTRLLRSYEPGKAAAAAPGAHGGHEDLEVPDPYYGGREGFETVYRMVRISCEGLIDTLVEQGAP